MRVLTTSAERRAARQRAERRRRHRHLAGLAGLWTVLVLAAGALAVGVALAVEVAMRALIAAL